LQIETNSAPFMNVKFINRPETDFNSHLENLWIKPDILGFSPFQARNSAYSYANEITILFFLLAINTRDLTPI
jgi:hypothetical protein